MKPPMDDARVRMTELAANLNRVFTPAECAELLIGSGLAVLRIALGPAEARRFIETLADEMAADETAIEH